MAESNEQELQRKVTALARRRFGGDFEMLFEHYSRKRQSDERIDRDELKEVLADADVGNWNTRSAWVNGILSQIDTDRDGAVSWGEFERLVNAYSTR